MTESKTQLEKQERPAISLLREKILVVERDEDGRDGRVLETLRSNRCAFTVRGIEFVVRTKYVHHSLRMMAKLVKDFEQKGPFGVRKVDFNLFWQETLSAFDRDQDTIGWCQFFIDGEVAFATEAMPYAEVIERCAIVAATDDYEASFETTERMFADSGKHIELRNSSILTATVKEFDDYLTCAIINRKGKSATISSMSIMHDPNRASFSQGLDLTANFLEAINLGFRLEKYKKQYYLSQKSFPQHAKNEAKDVRARKFDLDKAITMFEQTHKMRYRPERPQLMRDDDAIFND